jgi:threonine aldolase
VNFASDNWAGASQPVMEALAAHAGGFQPAYGNDDLTARVTEWFSEIFERDVEVFFVATGTAANSLAVTALTRPGGVLLCHAGGHVNVDEGGASEFLAGAKIQSLPGKHGKIAPETLAAALGRYRAGNVHRGRPTVLSLTQATEVGTVYTGAEIARLAGIAKEHGLGVHMDGARFANAVAALNASPADITWRAGVDVLSFGGTKNGCWCAEAVVFFDKAKARDFAEIRMRAGHLFSKSRFVAAQFYGYFDHGHWLDNAAHANLMARRLAEGIEQTPDVRLALPVQANEVFAIWPKATSVALTAAGAHFYAWPADTLGDALELAADHELVRLVTSFATKPRHIEELIGALAQVHPPAGRMSASGG